MRFEIKGGGLAAILLSLGILSGAVFVLGLLAGYDVGRQSQIDAAQVAASYPLQPSAPAATAAAASTATTETAATSTQEMAAPAPPPPATENVASAIPEAASARPQPAALAQPRPHAVAPHQRLASATVPPTASRVPAKAYNGRADETDDSEQTESTAAAPQAAAEQASAGPERTPSAVTPRSHRKPYNIQIEAAMDITGAREMMARLRKLGYPSHLVPTDIDGQRWYKVEVGPYATEEEASSSEAELRQKYDAAYGGGAHATPPPPMSGGDNADE
jgi:cell division septation protein DedD